MDSSMQGGGTQFSLESLMTPNFVFFVVTLAIIGYLYQTRMILNRESDVKSKSSNLFDKQMYLEIGFMVLIGFCMYIFNNTENTNYVWIYMLIPIIYLVAKSLLVFNKVTDFIKEAPEYTDVSTDIVDLINANKNTNVGQVPVTNQNSNTQNINNQLTNSLGLNNNTNPPLNSPTNRNNNVMPPPPQFGGNAPSEGFALF
jgi:hypothetical protein